MPSVQQLSNPQSGMQNLANMAPMQQQMYPQMQQQMQAQYPSRYDNSEKKYSRGKRIGRGIKHFFAGRSEKFEQQPTVTPEVMQVLQQILQGGMQNLQNPYEGFEPIAQQAREQFATNTAPGIAERFTALGGEGTRRSPNSQGAIYAAGAGLDRQLAALRSQYGFQNRGQALEQLQLGMHPQFETIHRPAQNGLFQDSYQLAMKGVGAAAKAYGAGYGGSFFGG